MTNMQPTMLPCDDEWEIRTQGEMVIVTMTREQWRKFYADAQRGHDMSEEADDGR